MMMTMMMICIVWLLRPTTLPKSAVLVGGCGGGWGCWGGVGGGKGCLARSALVQHRGQPGNRFLPPLPTHSSATLLICSSSRAMPPMYLLESTIGEQLELLPVQPLRNNQVFPTSVKSAKSDYYLIFGKIWVANDETCRLSFSFSEVPRHFNSADHKVL